MKILKSKFTFTSNPCPAVFVSHCAQCLNPQGRTGRDNRRRDRVDKIDFLSRVVCTWSNQEPLITCHAFGPILIGEVFVGSQPIRLILLDHGQLGDTTRENFAWVEGKRVLGQTYLLVTILEFILTILVLLNFFILKRMLGISIWSDKKVYKGSLKSSQIKYYRDHSRSSYALRIRLVSWFTLTTANLVPFNRILNNAIVTRRDDDKLFLVAHHHFVILADEHLGTLLQAGNVWVFVENMNVLIWS